MNAPSTAAAEPAKHARRVQALREQLRDAGEPGVPLGLAKVSSNLFRDRQEPPKRRLDLRDFCHVLQIDADAGWVDVEGLCSYEALVDALLPHGLMPAVVPQLKGITVAGAVAGVGIEATSFRQGLVHDTVLAIDVLLADGELLHCTPDNEQRDLFYGFANSYGTLGYALKLRLGALPVKPYVQVQHQRHQHPQAYFGALAQQFHGDADFVDGVVFDADRQVLSVARFVDDAPWHSDYSYEKIYYRSLLERETDLLRTRDYLWRWDTDWFWCSRQFGAQQPLLRRLIGRQRLNSRTYARWMRWNARLGLTRHWAQWRGRGVESVIQDVDIPLVRAEEFLRFLLREIGILPIWVCPIRATDDGQRYPLYPLQAHTPYLNFGFWGVIDSPLPRPPGEFNRRVERQVMALGGIKSLYSDSYFSRDEFDRAYGRPAYDRLKARYDPKHRLLDLYDKCVLRG
jgi:FAD/FMN-containing dehydrogenase